MHRRTVIAAVLTVALLAACSGDDDSDSAANDETTTSAPAEAPKAIVLNGQGNDLAAYQGEPPFEKQIVIHHLDEEHPDGRDINGQICFDPENPRHFVAGEDTNQTTTAHAGWGIFELEGSEVGDLSATQLAKLLPTYQPSADNSENYGCGFLPNGNIVTTDVGNQASGPGDGQLIVWFPPFISDEPGDADGFAEVAYCKVDIALATGQGVAVDDDYVYVASARPPGSGIFRYAIADLPTSATADGGCDSKDSTGAPLTTKVKGEKFIIPDETNGVLTPNAIAMAPFAQYFVTSVFTGVISQFDTDGTYVRRVLTPPDGEALGEEPFSTGTPLGIGVGPDGSIYYADIGIVASGGSIGPGEGTGKVRRIAFTDGEPEPPETMDDGLAFPDGIGVWVAPD